MLKLTCRALVASLALLMASEAAAQTGRPLTVKPDRFPRWDVDGGLGLFTLRPLDGRDLGNDWDGHFEVRFDVGRYWTTHLKTELGLSLPQTWNDYRYEPFPVSGLPSAYSFTNIDRRLTTLSPAITYQFLENTFAHPFVSTGVRLGFLDTHTYRDELVYTQSRVSYTVPALDERASTLRVNPFIAGGFKSYFSDHTFVRTEALVAFSSHGADQMTYRLAFGIDF